MAFAKIDRLDDTVGASIERVVVAHHRRRLSRRGFLGPINGLVVDG